jgi:hypothetical protein
VLTVKMPTDTATRRASAPPAYPVTSRRIFFHLASILTKRLRFGRGSAKRSPVAASLPQPARRKPARTVLSLRRGVLVALRRVLALMACFGST